MALVGKDISLLSQKSSISGTEKLPVSDTEYITPTQIAGLVSTDTAIETTIPAGGFVPKVVYDLGVLTGNVSFTLASPSDNSVANPYQWTFETGNTVPNVQWPNNTTFPSNFTPTINTNCHYEVFVRKGYITLIEFALS